MNQRAETEYDLNDEQFEQLNGQVYYETIVDSMSTKI